MKVKDNVGNIKFIFIVIGSVSEHWRYKCNGLGVDSCV